MDNPIVLRSRRAMEFFGALIRQWTLDPASRPASSRMESDRLCVIPVATFRELMSAAGLAEGTANGNDGDYLIRGDVESVELVMRTPGRLSFLMPEPDILEQQSVPGADLSVRVPALYDLSKDKGQLAVEVSQESDAYYRVTPKQDPLRLFLDPYLAGYLCMQCK